MNARLLVAVLEGIGPQDINPRTTPFLARTGHRAPLRRTTALAPARELLAGDLAAECRELGLQVEQRSIVLRPTWRGDAAVLLQLAQRPLGPADITLLRLTDVARAAAETGAGSQARHQALAQLDTQLGTTAETLARGGQRPDVALLCMGPMQPTARTFDPLSWLRQVPRALRRQLHPRMTAGALRVRCDSFQAEAHLRSLLGRHPFDGHSRLATDEVAAQFHSREVLLLAREGVSFGADRVRARLPYLPNPTAVDGAALLPWHEPAETTIPRVAAHILRHAAAVAEVRNGEDPSETVTAAADVDPLLEHDPFHVVEH